MAEQLMDDLSNEEHEALLLMCGHAVGPPLSPAAQAVLDAFLAEWPDEALEQDRKCLAAALRAAADQVVPEQTADRNLGHSWEYIALVSNRMATRSRLLAIAAELEALPE